ncbi:hypothetical protein [Paenibacillus macerans]|uniref:hypothetical protein n=1 Tax=Paenibacillus macerans TaxID=44252 RepID=UPI00203CA35F|nr:hypothetical protein [Paenibacillus macerans]MCM3702936.1 hypothetical protein [Paenibacillus macerans]
MAKRRRKTKKTDDAIVTASDLAIIGAGFAALGNFFELLSLLKLREEESADGEAAKNPKPK